MAKYKTVFCGPSCRDAYRADRKAGVVYPRCRLSDGREVSWEFARTAARECFYCRTSTAPLGASELTPAEQVGPLEALEVTR